MNKLEKMKSEKTNEVEKVENLVSEEVKQMKADPTMGKSYTDIDAMMEELLS